MNRHDLANLEQLALLREALEVETAQAEDVIEPDRPTSELARPDSPDADPELLSPRRRGLTGN